MTAEEKKARRRELARLRYANNPETRQRYQEKARARIPVKCEYEKEKRRRIAAEEGRLLGKQRTMQQQAEDGIMAEYEAERKTISKIERGAFWMKDARIVNAIACARLHRAWFAMTPEERKAKNKEKLSKVPRERLAEYQKRYYESIKTERPEEWRQMQRRYRSNLRKGNKGAQVRARSNLRSRFKEQLERYRATGIDSCSALLGCTKSFFAKWIEGQFTKGMRWDNYGSTWHIDHITPLAVFDAANGEDMRKAWHYTNLRPLKAAENMRKRDKIITHQPELILYLQ